MTEAIGAATVAVWIYLLFFRGGFWRLPFRRSAPAGNPSPRSVVAVVPARDEAATIGQAVASLLAQDYRGDLHIVVVDDESSDDTAEAAGAAAGLAHSATRLTVCAGKPVPSGWAGKLWAMHQGVEAAQPQRPDYFLFTDADIVHAQSNLRELVWCAESESYDLVSLMVKLHCSTIWERLLIPAFVFFFFKLYPPRWVADRAHRTAAAAGGCMLIRAATLDRIGGLAGIRHEIIDDCALARRVKSVGRVSLRPSAHTHSVRAYRSWRPVWGMIARSAFAQLGYSWAMLALTVIALGLIYLAPPLLLLSSAPAVRVCGGLAWLAMCIAYSPTLRAYNASPLPGVLLPLIAVFYIAATVASAVQFWRGRGGSWKGRFQAAAPNQTELM